MSAVFDNPPANEIRQFLSQIQHIAVLGLSPKPERPSHQVAKALQGFGYHILPVRPAVDTLLGEPAVADLHDLTAPIDLVNVFRAPAHVAAIVETCIELKLPALWLQDGVIDHGAALRAREAGLFVVMDRCIYRDYMTLLRP